MALKDLADDLSVGLLRQWIKSRGALTAEDAFGLLNEFLAADPELSESIVGVIFSSLDAQQIDRLRRKLEHEMVRRGSRS